MVCITVITSITGGTRADTNRSTILSFEQAGPAYVVDAGTAWEDLNLPTELRAVCEIAKNEKADEPAEDKAANEAAVDESADEITVEETAVEAAEEGVIDEATKIADEAMAEQGFRQTEPPAGENDRYGYAAPEDEARLRESGQFVIYTLYYEDGSEAYRVYGTYDGENEGFYACDEDGNIFGIVLDVPVIWEGPYDADAPGTYTLTAQIEGYDYDGAMPTAVITAEPADMPEIGVNAETQQPMKNTRASYSIDLSAPASVTGVTYNGSNTLTFNNGAIGNNYLFTQSGVTNPITTISVPTGITTALTINGLNKSGISIVLEGTADLTLRLAGTNIISNGYITVPKNAALTIDSAAASGSEDGALSITNSHGARAGIGGNDTDSGKITIHGGTLTVTKSGGGAGIGGGAYGNGYVTITGGNVTVTSSNNDAAIGSGYGYARVGYVTITGGKVTAIGNNNSRTGAAIGGGYQASGEVTITGGTVIADISKTSGGADSGSNAAAIGGGEAHSGFSGSGVGTVTITGGTVTASSGNGAAIGNGTANIYGAAGKIIIKDAAVATYSVSGSGIGSGHGSTTKPVIDISRTADITFIGRAQYNIPAGISCSGANQGDGYYVNLYYTTTEGQGVDNKRVAIFNADDMTLLRIIAIPSVIGRFEQLSFTTGSTVPKNYKVYLDNGSGFTELIRQDKSLHPTLNVTLHSINNYQGYEEFMFGASGGGAKGDFLHVVKGSGAGFGLNWLVYEKYVDMNGNAIPGKEAGTTTLVPVNTAYSKAIPVIVGYDIKGFKLDDFANSLNPSTTASIPSVTGDRTVYFVYGPKATGVTITAHYIDKATGNSIRPPDTHSVIAGDPFTLSPIPSVSGYRFADEWKEGSSGAIKAPPVSIASVTSNTDI